MADPASCNLLPSLVSGQYTGPSKSVLQAQNYISCDAERLFMSVDDPSSIDCPDLEHNDTHENGIILYNQYKNKSSLLYRTGKERCNLSASKAKMDVILPENVRDAVFKVMANLPLHRRTIPEVFMPTYTFKLIKF